MHKMRIEYRNKTFSADDGKELLVSSVYCAFTINRYKYRYTGSCTIRYTNFVEKITITCNQFNNVFYVSFTARPSVMRLYTNTHVGLYVSLSLSL